MAVKDPHIAQALRDQEAAYQAAKTAYEAQARARESVWQLAHEHGETMRDIAGETGVSFQLVGKILGRAGRWAA